MIVILVFAVVLICAIVLLPYVSGLTRFEKNKPRRAAPPAPAAAAPSAPSYGYTPPDEFVAGDEESASLRSRASALKSKISVTADDIPVKIALLEHPGLRKRTTERLDTDSDPNNYDYDLDELIREEKERAVDEQRREHYRNEVLGGDKEAMV
jgi:hypothetical protein